MISDGRHEVRLPGRGRLESQCGKTLLQHRDGQLGQSAIGHVLAQIVASQRPTIATGGRFRWRREDSRLRRLLLGRRWFHIQSHG